MNILKNGTAILENKLLRIYILRKIMMFNAY
jgi:hypothetical protein